MDLHPIVLSGGSGTRLWPLSRDNYPKQFLRLFGEKTLFQNTVNRLDGLQDIATPIVVCNEAHRFLMTDQLTEISITAKDVILEPEGRNTAPALTLGTLALIGEANSDKDDPVMLVMPSDHLIRDVNALHQAIMSAAHLAELGYIVTLGVEPTEATSEYGYIKYGEVIQGSTGQRIDSFVEKPPINKAKEYLNEGGWYWNSGIFIMRASVWIKVLAQYRPTILQRCTTSFKNGSRDGVFYRPDPDGFSECLSESIDYAVMNNLNSDPVHSKTAVISMDAGWTDLGAWSVLWEKEDQDHQGNVIQGDVYTYDTENTLLIAEHRLLASVGMKDVIVVETADAVLVAPRDKVHNVKTLVESLKTDGRQEHSIHRKVHRPWGTYEVIDSGLRFQVKRLSVNSGASISLQKHDHRSEHWIVVEGEAQVTRGHEKFILKKNQSSYVPRGTMHRLENVGSNLLEIIEVQTGDYLGEDDILRVDDDYNRHV